MPAISLCLVFVLSFVSRKSLISANNFAPCDAVCGVSKKRIVGRPHQLPRDTLQVERGTKFYRGLLYRKWRTHAVRFARAIGINDTFRCVEHMVDDAPPSITQNTAVWEYLWRPDRHLSAFGKSVLNFERKEDTEEVKPRNLFNVECTVYTVQGLYEYDIEKQENRTAKNVRWIMRIPIPIWSARRGALVVMVNNETRNFENIALKSRTNDTCVKTSSCEQWTTLLFGRMRNTHSMFSNLKHEEIPGVSRAIHQLQEKQEAVQSVEEDVSWSNLAILFLPLLMSIPPISLLESVSTGAVIAYVIATDVLAVCPCLIKGIELLISSRRNYMTDAQGQLHLTGKSSGLFERWYVRCASIRPNKFGLASGLMGAAIWFMCATTFTEFLFWRA